MSDLGSVIVLLVGALLVVLLALVCACVAKYLLASRTSNKQRKSELTYMLTVDKKGNIRIKKHRGNAGVIQQWGNDDV